jgi:hypothetical protein
MSRLAYCQERDSFAFDQSRIKTVLADIGFDECHFFESQNRPQGRGTHCFFALSAGKKLAIAAFRGTDKDDPTDIGDDANVLLGPWKPGGLVHTGFFNALQEVRPALDLAVPGDDWRVLYTGHSLGAALATLLASGQHPSALYTYGSPRVGDDEFVTTLEKVPHSRYVDCCDIVARIPPETLGYEHIGDPYYIDRSGLIKFDPPIETMEHDRMIAAAEYFLAYSWRHGTVAVRELADHAPINYVSAVLGARH